MFFNNDFSSKEKGKLKLRNGVYSINELKKVEKDILLYLAAIIDKKEVKIKVK